LKVSGQYQRLANASIDLKLNKTLILIPVVNQLMIGQVNAVFPYLQVLKYKTVLKPMTICIWLKRLALCRQRKMLPCKSSIITQFIQSTKNGRTLKRKSKSAQQRVDDFLELEKMESFLEMIC
jgi:hypothetical protein